MNFSKMSRPQGSGIADQKIKANAIVLLNHRGAFGIVRNSAYLDVSNRGQPGVTQETLRRPVRIKTLEVLRTNFIPLRDALFVVKLTDMSLLQPRVKYRDVSFP